MRAPAPTVEPAASGPAPRLQGARPAAAARRHLEAFVTLTDGRNLRGRVVTFDPNRRLVVMRAEQASDADPLTKIPLERVRTLAFLANPGRTNFNPVFSPSARLVTLRLAGGDTLRGVTESFGGARPGLFVIPVDSIWYERMYVPITSIREVVDSQPLETVLGEHGPATLSAIQRALQETPSSRPDPTPKRNGQHRGFSPLREAAAARRRIGQILVERGFIGKHDLEDVLAAQREAPGKRLGQLAVELGLATHKTIAVALAVQYGVPFVDLACQARRPDLARVVPRELATEWKVVPVSLRRGLLTVAVADPTDPRALDMLRARTGLEVAEVVASEPDIERALARLDG